MASPGIGGGGLMGCGAGRGVCILLVRVGCGKVQTTWVRSSARSRRLGACDAGVNDRFSLESEAVRCRLTAVASPARNPGTAAFDAKEFALDQKGPLHFFEFLATGRKAPQNCLSHSFRGSGPENPELEHVKTQDWFIQVASGEVGSEGFQVLVLAYGSCKTAASIWQLSLRNLFSLPCNTDSISGCLMGRWSLCADKVDACFAVITQFFFANSLRWQWDWALRRRPLTPVQ